MHKKPDKMQNVIIFGASGHGSVVLDCIEKEAKYNVVGFADSFEEKGTEVCGYQVLGSEYDLPFLIEKYQLQGGVVAIGDNSTRSLVVQRILKIAPNFNYISVVHPKAELGKGVHIGAGSVVMPGVTINVNARIGKHCIINTNSSLGHDGLINDFSSLAPGVCVGGNFVLGKGSAICLGSNIIENITIGSHSVVGAGSLVLDSIADNLLVYGAPARVIKKRIASEPYLAGKKKLQSLNTLQEKKI
jgi:sugar O-acyltransferase (sialic acid O-acetyltransferase NeuD family)